MKAGAQAGVAPLQSGCFLKLLLIVAVAEVPPEMPGGHVNGDTVGVHRESAIILRTFLDVGSMFDFALCSSEVVSVSLCQNVNWN